MSGLLKFILDVLKFLRPALSASRKPRTSRKSVAPLDIKSQRQRIEVVGESHINDDGTNRQTIIAKLSPGDAISLVREPENQFDRNAIAVFCLGGQIGYLSGKLAIALAPREPA